MTKAIVAGMPKLRIEEAATRRQARIDSGEDVIVGVNKYPPPQAVDLDVRDIDNSAVRDAQVRRLAAIRSSRDGAAVERALDTPARLAKSGQGNLLAAAIDAARARCTVGEISGALEDVYTRHRAEVRAVSGVYGASYQGDDDFTAVSREVAAFAKAEGRQPRMLVVKLGQDGHDRGMKVIATAFADLGFDVDVGRCSRPPKRRRARRSTTTCTRSACRARRPATRRSCPSWCRRSPRRALRRSPWWSAESSRRATTRSCARAASQRCSVPARRCRRPRAKCCR
jgi:methylmalonyl-CoA mutase